MFNSGCKSFPFLRCQMIHRGLVLSFCVCVCVFVLFLKRPQYFFPQVWLSLWCITHKVRLLCWHNDHSHQVPSATHTCSDATLSSDFLTFQNLLYWFLHCIKWIEFSSHSLCHVEFPFSVQFMKIHLSRCVHPYSLALYFLHLLSKDIKPAFASY